MILKGLIIAQLIGIALAAIASVVIYSTGIPDKAIVPAAFTLWGVAVCSYLSLCFVDLQQPESLGDEVKS